MGGFKKHNHANLGPPTAPLTDRDRWTVDVTAKGNRWISDDQRTAIGCVNVVDVGPNHSTHECGWISISGWWYTYPYEKYESQLGSSFPIYGKIKNVPDHQSVMYLIYCKIAPLVFLGMNRPSLFWGGGVFAICYPSVPAWIKETGTDQNAKPRPSQCWRGNFWSTLGLTHGGNLPWSQFTIKF